MNETELTTRVLPLLGPRGTNLAFSPASVRLALAMVYGGARGETALELQRALGFDEPAREAAGAHRLQSSLVANRDATVHVANRLFAEDGHRFEEAFLATLRDAFDAPLAHVRFQTEPELARREINAWVGQQTASLIPSLLAPGTIERATKLALVNALYFRAAWEEPFDPIWTKPGSFFGAREAMASFMSRVDELAFREAHGMASVALPYRGGDRALIVTMPRKAQPLDDELDVAVAEMLEFAWSTTKPRTVRVELPRFTIDAALDFVPVLRELGARSAFEYGAADLSGMDGTRELFVGVVAHQAVVTVDEAGTVAAAATAAAVPMGGPPPKPVVFRAERPFVFAIVDRVTRSVLFAGRLSDLKP